MDSFSQYDREKVAQSGGIIFRVHRFLEKGIVQQLDTPDTGTNVEKSFPTYIYIPVAFGSPQGSRCQRKKIAFPKSSGVTAHASL